MRGRTPHVGHETAGISSSCSAALRQDGLAIRAQQLWKLPTIGFDIRQKRIDELKRGHDETAEVTTEALKSTKIELTADPGRLRDCTFFIVAVPTPIDSNNRPDLGPMISASRTVAPHLRKGDVVVFESTVYPGVTEEVCGPILEQGSGMKSGGDFFLHRPQTNQFRHVYSEVGP